MKKYALLTLSLALILSLFAGCKPKNDGGSASEPANRLEAIIASGKIIMGTSPDFAPMEFIDFNKTGQDQYVGAEIALGKYIANKLGVEIEIKPMDFTTLLAAVSTGTIDMALSGFAWREDRAESVGLSAFYNFESDDKGHGVIVPIDKATEYTDADSFVGKKLAVQATSLQYSLATDQLAEGVEYQFVSNLADAIMMLKTGKVDGVISAGSTGELLIKGAEDQFKFCDFYFEYESEGNVLAVNKNEPELLAKINEIIAMAIDENALAPMYTEAKTLADSLGIE